VFGEPAHRRGSPCTPSRPAACKFTIPDGMVTWPTSRPANLRRSSAITSPAKYLARNFLPVIREPPTASRGSRLLGYAIRNPTAHPVYENFRAQSFARLLQEEMTPQTLRPLGECMYGSHETYSACSLGCKETDSLVQLACEAAPRGVHGAKITGGGSGGTVVMIGDFCGETVSQIAADDARTYGRVPHVFSGSSPGAEEVGVLHLKQVD
jgi:galactokinase